MPKGKERVDENNNELCLSELPSELQLNITQELIKKNWIGSLLALGSTNKYFRKFVQTEFREIINEKHRNFELHYNEFYDFIKSDIKQMGPDSNYYNVIDIVSQVKEDRELRLNYSERKSIRADACFPKYSEIFLISLFFLFLIPLLIDIIVRNSVSDRSSSTKKILSSLEGTAIFFAFWFIFYGLSYCASNKEGCFLELRHESKKISEKSPLLLNSHSINRDDNDDGNRPSTSHAHSLV